MEPSVLNQIVIEKIHATEGQFTLAVTGGGTTAITDLLSVGGASRSLIEATIPYHADSLKRYLGAVSSLGCNARTARAMAMQSWLRAKALLVDAPIYGLGCTAAIATDRDRRGEDRCHLAIQSGDATLEFNAVLDKRQSREQQEAACNQLIITAMAQTLGIDVPDPEGLTLSSRQQAADPVWAALRTKADSRLL